MKRIYKLRRKPRMDMGISGILEERWSLVKREHRYDDFAVLCAAVILEFFDIPKSVNHIYATLSDKPMPESYFIKCACVGHSVEVTLSDGWKVRRDTYLALRGILIREFPNGCYGKIEYVAESWSPDHD